MASSEKNIIKLEINNIAPIEHLAKQIETKELKIGILGKNGSGKTFISRLFRLLEKNGEDSEEITQKLLRLKKETGCFKFKIIDKDGNDIEDIIIDLKRGEQIRFNTKPHYIYHTFNNDYIEENIKKASYAIRNENISGYILGKENIELESERKKLEECENELALIEKTLTTKLSNYIYEKTNHIPYIVSIKEYSLLNIKNILSPDRLNIEKTKKNVDEYLKDYEKVKSVPDDLSDIQKIKELENYEDFSELIQLVISYCEKKYSINTLALEFKKKIKSKQEFIESGISLLQTTNNKCPFCEQVLGSSAIELIDRYNEYLNDEEAKTVKELKIVYGKIKGVIETLQLLENNNAKRMNDFFEYKTKYIPSEEEIELNELSSKKLVEDLEKLFTYIEEKINNLNTSIIIPKGLTNSLLATFEELEAIRVDNNNKIEIINKKKDSLKNESKSIKREICKSAYIQVLDLFEEDLTDYTRNGKEKNELALKISSKEQKQKRSRSKAVTETINTILNYFFGGKYSLDESQYKLIFNKNYDDSYKVENVLSEGEKNIIAFAYYMGETHCKITNEADYKKLFFIIDDPISSMDFLHVYTLSGCLRKLKNIFPEMGNERLILLTHNVDFMRIQCSNKIVSQKMRLYDCQLLELNESFSIPYVDHLFDIFKISENKILPNHTTANSIRHVIETLVKFNDISLSQAGVNVYIQKYFSSNVTLYSLINDLSHGSWKSEQEPIDMVTYRDICSSIIEHIHSIYPHQIEFCRHKMK